MTSFNRATTMPLPKGSYLLRWRSRLYNIAGLALLLGVVMVVASAVGSVHIPVGTIWGILLSRLLFIDITPTWSAATETIIVDIRLPRVLLAGLVGAALAVAGAAYQGLFRNPLADPYLLGIASGAGLGAVVGFLLPVAGLALIPALAFLGGLMAVGAVYSIARVGKTLPVTTLILAGVALGAFLGSITAYLMIISGERLHGIISWLMGTFALSNWEQVWMIVVPCVVGVLVIWIHARPLNVMQLDEEQAQQLGINVERVKLILLVAATLITAAAVCFVGTIGFVGIIVPHAVRLIWGPDHRFLLPLTTLAGASFLILADTAARTVLAPTEIPVGVITAFLGAPFFLYLLRQKKRFVF
jgi:iron complex transport system permease protein